MTAQLTKFKTKNQLFNDFISISQLALETFEVQGWQIRQLSQVFKINQLNPTLFISIITNNQQGSQYQKKKRIDGIAKSENNSKQEVQIRFSALRRELSTDTLQTLNPVDILKLIKEFIQSKDGIKALSSLGYAQYRASDIQEQNFTNDSDNFEFLPYFDCTFLYTNSWTNKINIISQIKEKSIYKI